MIETISLTIDGKKVFVEGGTTILEAARQNGIFIPTLCYHPRLAPLGHCRLCVVEVEGLKRPITSCDNPATENMVVTTQSARLNKMRSGILELALATHPYKDCLTCVRTGSCELQERAYDYQVNLPAQLERSVAPGETVDNPYIVRDHQKCIICGRCIEACRTLAGRSVFSIIGSGVNTRVAPVKNGRVVSMLEAGCIFCGQCVDVCPVAALTESGRSTGGREWDLNYSEGLCAACSLCCYLERGADKNQFIKATVPAEGDPGAWLCQKGRFGFLEELQCAKGAAVLEFTGAGPEKITYPEAVQKVADKIKALKEVPGPQSIALIAAGTLSNEESFILQKMARNMIGTEHFNFGAEKLWAQAFTMAMEVTGLGIPGPTPLEISEATGITVIGAGLEESHPVAYFSVLKAARFGRAKVVNIAPAAGNTFEAWQVLNLPTDGAALSGLFQQMKNLKEKGAAEFSEKEAGFNLAVVKQALAVMQQKDSLTIVSPQFFKQNSKETLTFLIELLKSSDQLAKSRNKVMLLSAYSNACGVLLTGGTPWFDPGLLQGNLEKGGDQEAIIQEAREGKLKALLLFGDHYQGLKLPAGLFTVAVASCFEKAPANTTIYFPSEPLPYKKGYFTNAMGRTRANRAVESRIPFQDWRLIADLANKIGARWAYQTIEDVRIEMKSVTPAE